jgi:hypothetical protein
MSKQSAASCDPRGAKALAELLASQGISAETGVLPETLDWVHVFVKKKDLPQAQALAAAFFAGRNASL